MGLNSVICGFLFRGLWKLYIYRPMMDNPLNRMFFMRFRGNDFVCWKKICIFAA